MAQILRFFAWIAWGVVTTVMAMGLLATFIFEDAVSMDGVFTDPVTFLIIFGAYIPGGILYLLGYAVDRINAREAKKAENNTQDQ